jgi:uncharacterized protein (TIGR02147 family)
MTDIRSYLDYRQYLSDKYQELRQRKPQYSLRYVGDKIGIDHSSFLKILQGRRHLTRSHVDPLCKLFRLDRQQREYLIALMDFNKARNDSTKRRAFERLSDMELPPMHSVERNQYKFYTKWYYNAVRALLSLIPKPTSAKELGMLLSPRVTEEEAREALDLLEDVRLVKKTNGGRYELCDKYVTTGKHRRSDAIREFQRRYIALAQESFERHPVELRDISTVTVTVPTHMIDKIRDRIAELRTDILKMATQDADRVYQMNVQLFPLTEDLSARKGRTGLSLSKSDSRGGGPAKRQGRSR